MTTRKALTDPQLAALRTLAYGGTVYYIGTGKRLLGTLAALKLADVDDDLTRTARITATGLAVLELYRPLHGFVYFDQGLSRRRGVARNDQGGATVTVAWHAGDTHNKAGTIITRSAPRHVQQVPRERIVIHDTTGATIGERIDAILAQATR